MKKFLFVLFVLFGCLSLSSLALASEPIDLGVVQSNTPTVKIQFQQTGISLDSVTLVTSYSVEERDIIDGCFTSATDEKINYCQITDYLLPGVYTLVIDAVQDASPSDNRRTERYLASFQVEASDMEFWISSPRTDLIQPARKQNIAMGNPASFTIQAQTSEPARCVFFQGALTNLGNQASLATFFSNPSYEFIPSASFVDDYAKQHSVHFSNEGPYNKTHIQSSLFQYSFLQNNMYTVICELHPSYRTEGKAYEVYGVFMGYDTTPPEFSVEQIPERVVDKNIPITNLSIRTTGVQNDFISCKYSLNSVVPSLSGISFPRSNYNSVEDASVLSSQIIQPISFQSIHSYLTLGTEYEFSGVLTCKNPANLETTYSLTIPVQLADGITITPVKTDSWNYYNNQIIYTAFDSVFSIRTNIQSICIFDIGDERHTSEDLSNIHSVPLQFGINGDMLISVTCSAQGSSPVTKEYSLFLDTSTTVQFTEHNILNSRYGIVDNCGTDFTLYLEKPIDKQEIKYEYSLYKGAVLRDEFRIAGPLNTSYTSNDEFTLELSQSQITGSLQVDSIYTWVVRAIDLRNQRSSLVDYTVTLRDSNHLNCEGFCRIDQDCPNPGEFCTERKQCETGTACASINDPACGSGFFCNLEKGFCQQGCITDGHCNTQYAYCDELVTYDCQEFCKINYDCRSLSDTYGAELFCVNAQTNKGRCFAFCQEGLCGDNRYCDVYGSDFLAQCKQGCMSDDNCAEGLYCDRDELSFESGVCKSPCTNNDDCKDSGDRIYCNTQEEHQYFGYCQDVCYTHDACGEGKYCGYDMQCHTGCVEDSCATGSYCSLYTNPSFCQSFCEHDDECKDEYYAFCDTTGQRTDDSLDTYNPNNGMCVSEKTCEQHADCGTGTFCSVYAGQGYCVEGCVDGLEDLGDSCGTTAYCSYVNYIPTCVSRCTDNDDCTGAKEFCQLADDSLYTYQTCTVYCSQTTDCKEGLFCVGGTCQDMCYGDESCPNPSTEYCSDFFGCVSTCSSNEDCADLGNNYNFCDTETGRCTDRCSVDTDCSAGYCDAFGSCQTGCAQNDHCQSGEYCDVYVGECNSKCFQKSDCPTGMFCHLSSELHMNQCVDFCSEQTDCSTGTYCSGYSCLSGCVTNENCGNDQYCSQFGTCIDKCSSNADCSSPTPYCNTNDASVDYQTCQAICSADSECGEGSFCDESGVCQSGCRNDGHCSYLDGTYCYYPTNRCVDYCTDDNQCSDGYCSDEEKCVYYCTDDTDCDSPMKCTQGECALEVECIAGYLDTCASTEYCTSDYVCEPRCTSNDDCSHLPKTEFCDTNRQSQTYGSCVSFCSEHDDCDNGYCSGLRCQSGCTEDDHCSDGYCDLYSQTCASYCTNSYTCTQEPNIFCNLDADSNYYKQCVSYCTQHSDCSDGYCSGGFCYEGCIDSLHCAEGEFCNLFGSCQEKCTSTEQCGEDLFCYLEDETKEQYQHCVQFCSNNGDCGSGRFCTTEGFCQTGCSENSDCQGTDVCEYNVCVPTCQSGADCSNPTPFCNLDSGFDTNRCVFYCTNHDQCVDGYCDGGQCMTGCAGNSFCSSDQYCAGAEGCVDNCKSNAECAEQNPNLPYCNTQLSSSDFGRCVGTCSSNADCSDGYCNGGYCYPGCSIDSDCTSDDQYCNAGECVSHCDTNSDCSGITPFCYTLSDESVQYRTCVSECSSNLDCPTGRYCSLYGTCESGCYEHDQCGTNQYCDVYTSTCQTKCYDQMDCSSGYCDVATNQCQPYCATDKQCGDAKYCDYYGNCVAGCSADDDCDLGNEVCLEGRCVVEDITSCSRDEQCHGTDVCENRRCVPGSAFVCASNDDCRFDEYCSPTRSCLPIPGDCYDDLDCRFNYYCTPEFSCELIQGSCENNNDCHYSEYCSDSTCVAYPINGCVVDADCSYDAKCMSGNCQSIAPLECVDSQDCAYNKYCSEGVCYAITGDCQEHSDCAYDQTCQNYLCVDRPAQCGDTSCLTGEVCTDGKCFPEEYDGTCETNLDCIYDEYCSSLGNCTKITGDCVFDEHCAYNQYCTDTHTCEPILGSCVTDENCAYTHYCSTGNKCIAYGSRDCVNDEDCSWSQYCTVAGTCQSYTTDCYRNEDCNFNEFCNVEKKCEVLPGSCYDSTYCAYDEYCTDSFTCALIEGGCSTSTHCRSNEFCDAGVCRLRQPEIPPEEITCTDGGVTCPTNYLCGTDGKCQRAPECMLDSDCRDTNEICEESKCVVVDYCSTDNDCVRDLEFCSTNGVCRPNVVVDCIVDDDCLKTEFCDTKTNICKEQKTECISDFDCVEENTYCGDTGMCVSDVAHNPDDYMYGDTDNDGLPDYWEMKYFGNLDQGPDDDYDGDGVSNLQEYKDGTDPTDPTDYRASSIGVEAGTKDDVECVTNYDCLVDERCSYGQCVLRETDDSYLPVQGSTGPSLIGLLFVISGFVLISSGAGYIYYSEWQRKELQKQQQYRQMQYSSQQQAQMDAQRREREAKYAEYMKKKQEQGKELRQQKEQQRQSERKSVFSKFENTEPSVLKESKKDSVEQNKDVSVIEKKQETLPMNEEGYVDLEALQKQQKAKEKHVVSKKSALDDLEEMVTTKSSSTKQKPVSSSKKTTSKSNESDEDVFGDLEKIASSSTSKKSTGVKKNASEKKQLKQIEQEVDALKKQIANKKTSTKGK